MLLRFQLFFDFSVFFDDHSAFPRLVSVQVSWEVVGERSWRLRCIWRTAAVGYGGMNVEQPL
jgi:hypothetical protein